MLVNYSDDDSDDDDDDAPRAVQPTAFAAAADEDDEDEDDASAPPAKTPRMDAPPAAQSSASVLPDFEDALSQAETPTFLSAPSDGHFEHVAFDSRPPPPPPEEKAAASSSMPPPRAPPASTAAAPAAAAAARDRARGADARKGDKKDKESVKDRTKIKRERDQSASFLGGRWKSDEEMHMRDNFDS